MTDMISREAALAAVNAALCKSPLRMKLDLADAVNDTASAIHALPTMQMKVAVKVKPLKWVGNIAKAPFGSYSVVQSNEKEKEWIVYVDRDYLRTDAGGLCVFFGDEDAKAAAQADYETRILAALDLSDKLEQRAEYLRGWNAAMASIPKRVIDDPALPDHVLADPRVKALMGAAKERLHFFDDTTGKHCPCRACEPLYAALRAIGGAE